MKKSLDGIRVVDLSRILAGPSCTQILGDLGAEIIKIEKPGIGDDTRGWGPPFLQNSEDQDTSESAYYLSCNRNKKSVAIDIRSATGQELLHKLLANSDILIENFKTGGLDKYGLGFEQIHARHPHIIYASITGFGQTGPLASEPGYDFVAQAMSGLMACTGDIDGAPMKAGVALSDVMTGLNAAIGILAALNHRHHTGRGQHIDLSLLDCTLAAMTNVAQYYLTSGRPAARHGNAHSTIVPYQAFEAQDGYIILAVGNDSQFQKFCTFIDRDDWAEDNRFATNSERVQHRSILVPLVQDIIAQHPVSYWIQELKAINVPCGPVNSMDQVFDLEQVQARAMTVQMNHPLSATPIDLVGSPLKLSETPVTYDLPPPVCGQHTQDVLENILGLEHDEITALEKSGTIMRSKTS